MRRVPATLLMPLSLGLLAAAGCGDDKDPIQPPPVGRQPVFAFTATTAFTRELWREVRVGIVRSGDLEGIDTVFVGVEAGTATPGEDIPNASTRVTFGIGQTQNEARLTLFIDGAAEKEEEYAVVLGSPSAGTVDADARRIEVTVDDTVPDFLLPDVNPNSSRLGEDVSPRDYLEKISGWYFGHAT